MRSAILQKLRLLIACLVLAAAARPAVAALQTPRAVAVFVAFARPAVAGAESARAAATRIESRERTSLLTLGAPRRARVDIAAPFPSSRWRPDRGTAPLYLTQRRFLL